jgi:uncharacterized membrane protein
LGLLFGVFEGPGDESRSPSRPDLDRVKLGAFSGEVGKEVRRDRWRGLVGGIIPLVLVMRRAKVEAAMEEGGVKD